MVVVDVICRHGQNFPLTNCQGTSRKMGVQKRLSARDFGKRKFIQKEKINRFITCAEPSTESFGQV